MPRKKARKDQKPQSQKQEKQTQQHTVPLAFIQARSFRASWWARESWKISFRNLSTLLAESGTSKMLRRLRPRLSHSKKIKELLMKWVRTCEQSRQETAKPSNFAVTGTIVHCRKSQNDLLPVFSRKQPQVPISFTHLSWFPSLAYVSSQKNRN